MCLCVSVRTCVCRRVCPSFGDAHERPGLGCGTVSRGAGASLQSGAIVHVSGGTAGPQTVPGVAQPLEAVPGHAPILEDQAWRARPSADLHISFGVFVGTHVPSAGHTECLLCSRTVCLPPPHRPSASRLHTNHSLPKSSHQEGQDQSARASLLARGMSVLGLCTGQDRDEVPSRSPPCPG